MKSKTLLCVLKCFFFYSFYFVLVLTYIFLIAWTFCYSLYVCYLLTAALGASIIIFYVNNSKRQSVKFLILGLVFFFVLSPLNIKQYNSRAATFQDRVNRNEELNKKERLGLYGCLMIVTFFNIISFRELGTQNFYLFFPVKNQQRVFYSNSILNSPSIMREVKKKSNGHIQWNKFTSVFDPDFRYALAFKNSSIATEITNGYREVVITRNFSYRKNHFTYHAGNIFRGLFSFRIDEGLFWYLQQKGWLHPYKAIWIAKLRD
jgi:hypothetical protein